MKRYIVILWVLIGQWATAQDEVKILKSASGKTSSPHDMFGWQVSHNDNFVLACAPHEDDVNTNTGAVYIFKRNQKSIEYKSRLSIADVAPFTMFGKLLAHTDEYLLVASQKPVQTPFGKGHLFLYKRNNDSWALVNTITATTSDNSPTSITMDGNTIVAGYSVVQSTNPNGYVMIYSINPTTNQITTTQKITVSGLKPFDLIGHNVCLNNNILTISSVAADGQTAWSGSVWVYQFTNGSWNLFTELKHPDAAGYDHFGYAVSIDAPFIAVGAPRQGSGMQTGKKAGAVYVYKLTETAYNIEAKLQADAAANDYDYFGSSIDIHNNILATGAYADDFSGRNTGAVYIFERLGNSWFQVNKIIGSNVNDHAFFGASVSLYNGSVLCSAHLEETDTVNKDHGAVYFYDNAKIPTGLWAGAQQDQQGPICMYPNPVNEFVHITFKELDTPKEIQVYDAKGTLVSKRYANPADNDVTLDCATWKRGIYIISVKTEGGVYNRQVVK